MVVMGSEGTPAAAGSAVRRRARGSSVRAQVYAMIQEEIVALEFKPGQPLSEKELAVRYGVSRTPAREALLQLADEGLVEIYPQTGTFVARISVHGVTEAQFIREALECAALRRAIDRFTAADIKRLEANIDRQRAAHADQDVATFYILDEGFHQALVERSGFPGVWRVAQRAKVHLNRARRLSLPAISTIGELIDQHAAILARLAAGDGPGAEAALAQHLRMVLADLPALQQRYSDFFTQDDATDASATEV
jgi:GntR family transcriptional regulator, rspAB operon transcriptional repressor